MKANARIEVSKQGFKVAQRANSIIKLTKNGFVIKSSKLTLDKLNGSLLNSDVLLAA